MRLSSKLRGVEGGRLSFWCPGCKSHHTIRHGAGEGPRWGWNGNVDSPTFTPSILVTWPEWHPPVTPENHAEYERNPWPQKQVNRVCHSFVTNGQIQFLADCTHELAGKTVPMPDLPYQEVGESQ